MKIKHIVGEAIEIKPMPGASQIIGDDGKPIGTADAATANVIKQAADKGTFNLGSPGTEMATAETQEEEENDTMASGRNDDIGGDPTDDFISDITDHDYENAAGALEPDMAEGFFSKSAEDWAQTSPQMAKLLQYRAKAKGTPYEAQVEQRIKLLKDRLDLDQGEVGGPGGVPKDPVPPEQFNMKQLREADDVLLEKMRMIAGLR
jgi:hypothetical protein